MTDPTKGPKPSPPHDSERSTTGQSTAGDAASPEDVWFAVQARDGTLVGTADVVVHRRADPDGSSSVQRWRYRDLRSLHVLEDPGGGSIVIEPRRGPLVPVPILADQREEAYQAATVFELLIARAERVVGSEPFAPETMSTPRPHRLQTGG